MTLVAAWLLSVGVADAVTSSLDNSLGRRRALLGVLSGAGSALLLLALCGAALRAALLLAAGFGLALALWLWTSRRAISRSRRTRWPLVVMVTSLAVLLATSGSAPPAAGVLGDWYQGLAIPVLERVPVERFLVGLGSTAYLQVTANVLVRLALTAAGTSVQVQESTLKGGRLLGPMERTFLFGLTLAGELTAAAVIVAAKGALRFPEIQSAPGASGVTEYFLIGTLSSLLVALSLATLV